MSLRTACYVTGCGNAFFAQTFMESWRRFTNPRICNAPIFVLDSGVGTNTLRFYEWLGVHALCCGSPIRLLVNEYVNGSINKLWNWTVHEADKAAVDIAIVCNDDIYFAPGWLEAIMSVFENNPHVALCGIPAPGAMQDELKVRERWFMDASLFYGEDFDKITKLHSGMKPKYQGWTSGFLWACRVKPWLQHAVIPADKWAWGYAEPSMGLSLYRGGWYTVSVYDPLILHYGGGAYWTVGDGTPARQIHNATIRATGGDANNFAAVYGTSELQDLHEQWQREFDKRTDVPKLSSYDRSTHDS